MALSRPCPGRSHEDSATHMGLGYHIAHLFGHQPRSTKSYSTNRDCGPGAPGDGGGGGGTGGGGAAGTPMRSPFAHPEAHNRAGAGPDGSPLKYHTSVPANSFGPADGVTSASGVSGLWDSGVHAWIGCGSGARRQSQGINKALADGSTAPHLRRSCAVDSLSSMGV